MPSTQAAGLRGAEGGAGVMERVWRCGRSDAGGFAGSVDASAGGCASGGAGGCAGMVRVRPRSQERMRSSRPLAASAPVARCAPACARDQS